MAFFPSFENILLSVIGPMVLIYGFGGPYNIKKLIIFIILITIYNQLINYYKCFRTKKSYNYKKAFMSPISWYIWSIAVFVLFHFLKNPIFLLVGNITASFIGIILVGLIFYLPSLKLSSECF